MADEPKPDVRTPLHEGPPSVIDFLSQLRGPGYVDNEEEARDSPCIAYEVGEKRRLVFSPGVTGALDLEQEALFCGAYEERPLSPAQQERMEALASASRACSVQVEDVRDGEKLEPFLRCIHEELRERGQQL